MVSVVWQRVESSAGKEVDAPLDLRALGRYLLIGLICTSNSPAEGTGNGKEVCQKGKNGVGCDNNLLQSKFGSPDQ